MLAEDLPTTAAYISLRRVWSCDHREGSRDLAGCTAMILVDPIIDPAASELTDSTCIDRVIGLGG